MAQNFQYINKPQKPGAGLTGNEWILIQDPDDANRFYRVKLSDIMTPIPPQPENPLVTGDGDQLVTGDGDILVAP